MGPPEPRDDDALRIGVDLERMRLEHRAHRVRRVIAVLRNLAATRSPTDRGASALRRAIDGFSDELAHLDRRLHEIGRASPAATTGDDAP
ncbi:MAG TPA: hypothetical protein VHB30_07015 [Solirubrobacteraceae bacterium]|jgi:hypothetical protein|nr:hypothetical protein [Solirubrobacteraceae bacterium]